MTKDYIGYRALTDAALRGVVREAIKRVEKQGLIGAHHFRLTFKTHYPGVEIPEFLLNQYPDEMTIILQHQFWGLKVKENHFEVALSFKKVPATLAIPFGALTSFVDPGVQFVLQFQPELPEAGRSTLAPLSPTPLPTPEKSGEESKPADKSVTPGEVVSLDSFRKK